MMSMVRVSTCKHKREYEDADGEETMTMLAVMVLAMIYR